MPLEVLNKIKYLCKSISKEEWSGPLFYTIEGSIKKPETLKITLQDILPLDKGTTGFTSYSFDERFVDFLMEDPQRMDWHVGHIHSHHSMNVYFSGTDTDELHENAPQHNMYLSLIVNNFMEFVAQLVTVGTVTAETAVLPITALDEDGNPYEIGTTAYDINEQKLYMFKCAIDAPLDTVTVDDWFTTQVAEIMKPKPKAPITTGTPMYTGVGKVHNPAAPKKPVDVKDFAKKFAETVDFDRWEEEDSEYEEQERKLNIFVVELFKLSSEKLDDDTLDSVLSDLGEFGKTSQEIATSILEMYVPVFEKHYEDADHKAFSSITWDVIDLLRDEESYHEYLPLTIRTLENFITNFDEETK